MAPRKDKKNHPGYDERGKRKKLTEEEKAQLGPDTFPAKIFWSGSDNPNRLSCLEGLRRSGSWDSPFPTPEDLAAAVDSYLAWCEERTVDATDKKTGEPKARPKARPYTFAGLAAFLGFKNTAGFFEQSKRGEKFKRVVDLTRTIFEAYLNEKLIDYSGMAGGVIFALKNTHGWTDQSQVNVVGSVNISGGLSMMPPAPKDMVEWQKWYKEIMGAKDQPEPIDVSPESCALPVLKETQDEALERRDSTADATTPASV